MQKLVLTTPYININCECDIRDFPDDISKMRKVLENMGYTVSEQTISNAYGEFCEREHCAGWLDYSERWIEEMLDKAYLIRVDELSRPHSEDLRG